MRDWNARAVSADGSKEVGGWFWIGTLLPFCESGQDQFAVSPDDHRVDGIIRSYIVEGLEW